MIRNASEEKLHSENEKLRQDFFLKQKSHMKTHFGSEPKQNIQNENLENFHLIPDSERECSHFISVCLIHGMNIVTAQ